RLLRNQRDLGAPDGAKLRAFRRHPRQIDGDPGVLLKPDPAADDSARWLDDLQDRLHRDALAAPAFADDADDLARLHVEAHSVDRAHQAFVEKEVDPEVLDLEDGLGHRLYGSAASRKPSPTRLKARTERMTTPPGTRSQGASATVWMFWASCRSTPQLIAGGRIPSPRKDRDVSLMIMAGMASVLVAMMWERNVGTKWRRMIRRWLAPAKSAA